MKSITIILFFIFFSAILEASNLQNIVKKVSVEPKMALIIGNDEYTNLAHLKNPLNDARLMKEVLKKNGFRIIYKENAKIKDMKKLLKKFSHRISKGGIGLYYFAGHSVNVDGKNYMLGIDSSLDNKDYIEHEAIVLNNIIKKMRNSGNRLNIIISDTCRNSISLNAFGHNHFSRGVGRGLTSLSNTKDIFIAYSTATGELVRDGKEGSNGILTKYFVENLKKEGATIREIFENTRKDIYEYTGSKQSPSAYKRIMKDFFFVLPTKR